jgi:hypothetical protein
VPRCVILVTGPESSGTRWISSIISQHPDINGTDGSHADPLDYFWNRQYNDIPEGLTLTRRSLPAAKGNRPAHFLDFEDFDRLYRNCDDLKVIVTVRSPYCNIKSWADSRASTLGYEDRAIQQYWRAYEHIFNFIDCKKLEFWLLPYEAVTASTRAVSELYPLLRLPPYSVEYVAQDANAARYRGV